MRAHAEPFLLADVRLSGAVPNDEAILNFSPAGMVVVAPLPDGVHRIVATVADALVAALAGDTGALFDKLRASGWVPPS